MSALLLALLIACFIKPFLTSCNFLSDNVKATLFILVAPPEDIAVSTHLAVSLIFELSICMELVTVNPVIMLRPCE